MIDLETLDTAPTAAILSVGAVMFDRVDGRTGDELYLVADPDTSIALGGTVSGDTVLWWFAQSNAARWGIVREPKLPIRVVLDRLRAFLPAGVRVWSKPGAFDLAVLNTAYASINEPTPWNHRDVRCLRTLIDTHAAGTRTPLIASTAHNALDDARSQAILAASLLCKNT